MSLPKSLFETNAIEELENRLEKLKATTLPEWGKMNASEMLNHCSSQMQINLGDKEMKSNFIMRIFGKFIKKNILAGKPTPKNSRTAKELLPTNVLSFEEEKTKFNALMQRMKAKGKAFEGQKHAFFGEMTSEEYGKIAWNHLDYHFTQFGI